ncbi:hypothetical protein SAMN05428949_6897 [Chitinophaga sp. YR627]|nr:hypothetical protein SAMN05428949_6897 [Chitinophaga sp. YR627]
MSNGRIKRFIISIEGIRFSNIIFSVVKIILCIYVLRTDPLSSGFGYLILLLFCVSVTRHLFLYFNKITPDNILTFCLDLLTPCLYGFVLYHMLSVYETKFLSVLVSIFLPGIVYCYLFAGKTYHRMDKSILWGGLFCYALPLLLALNYSFDYSRPSIEKYFLINKFSTTIGSDTEGYSDNYYFDLIHTDSIAKIAHWEDVDQKSCAYYRDDWMYKMIKLKNETFLISARKMPANSKLQCSFLLRRINGTVFRKVSTEQQYSHFERGDTLHVEKHRGLIGIKWLQLLMPQQ